VLKIAFVTKFKTNLQLGLKSLALMFELAIKSWPKLRIP